jgi:hypothetical protein
MVSLDRTFKENDAELMHRLFEDHVKRQMKDALRPQMEQILDEAVEKAVASIQTSINSVYSAHTNERLVRIILEDHRVKR